MKVCVNLDDELSQKVTALVENHGFTKAGAVRHMVSFHEVAPVETVAEFFARLRSTPQTKEKDQ